MNSSKVSSGKHQLYTAAANNLLVYLLNITAALLSEFCVTEQVNLHCISQVCKR